MSTVTIKRAKLEQWVKAVVSVARYAPAGEGVFSAVMMARDDMSEVLKQALAAPPVQEPRWYCVDKTGVAILCTDEDDAKQGAKQAEKAWPRFAPYRAVQLCEYTAPPAPVPLTDEQREEIAKGWRGRIWTGGDIIDATEAAHKITAAPEKVKT